MIRRWGRDGPGSSRLIQGSAWVLVGMAAQALLGFTFWTLSARVMPTDEVGRASALFTIAQFLTYSTGLGLTVMLARFATDHSTDSDRLFGRSVVIAVIASVSATIAFWIVGSSEATDLLSGPGGFAVFAFYVGGLAVGLLADVRLMAGRRWLWLVGRVVLVGLVRLPLVLWDPGVGGDTWLYHLVLAPLAIGGWLSFPMLRLIGEGRLRLGRPASVAGVMRFAGANWIATLASTAPQYVLPLVVVAHVADDDYANFFLAWTITAMVLLVPAAISQILLLEGSKKEQDGDGHEQLAFRFSLGIATIAWVGTFAGGRVLVWVLGQGYRNLADILPALVFAGLPWAYTSVRLAEARLRRDQLATVLITGILGLLILGLALVWVPRWGITGATRAWVIGNIAGAVTADLTHRIRGSDRHGRPRGWRRRADDPSRPDRAPDSPRS